MNTKIYNAYNKDKTIDKKELEEASKHLVEGELIAFPTETVYGLGVNAYSGNVLKVYEAKGRPQDNPLICHVGEIKDIELCGKPSELAKKLFQLFSPGPITIVIEKNDKISSNVTGGLSTVGVRIPENQVAREFLNFCKIPVAAPSANTSKRPSPTRARDVLEDLDGKIFGIIDGGECSVGIESTVVDARGDYPIILREGKITRENILQHFPRCEFAKSTDTQVRSPGVKYVHYAPNAEMYVHFGCDSEKINDFTAKINRKKIAIICHEDFACKVAKRENISVFAMGKSVEEYMHNYYSYLRDLEKHCDIILMQMPFSDEGITNRCKKSCGGKTI